MTPRYSGKASRAFWDRIRRLPEGEELRMYACGVLLQNLEGTVLQWLDNAEQIATLARRPRKKPTR